MGSVRETEVDSAIALIACPRCSSLQFVPEPEIELRVSHSVAFDLQAIFCIALIVDVNRRIRKHQVRCCAGHQLGHVIAPGRVAYKKFVIAGDPKVAILANGRVRQFWN